MTYTRRRFLGLAVGVVASYGPLGRTLSAAQSTAKAKETNQPYSDIDITDKWMLQWMNALGAANGDLDLGRFADRMYFLRKEINWSPNPGQTGKSVTVPVGFVTDFASIPRIFWSLLPPDGQYTYPAIIHDYLYWEQPVKREEADKILLYAMGDFNVASAAKKAIFAGVRVGGEFAWAENRRLRAKCEQRILKVFPSDPTTLWSNWKKRPDVFSGSCPQAAI